MEMIKISKKCNFENKLCRFELQITKRHEAKAKVNCSKFIANESCENNMILTKWNSLLNSFEIMKQYAMASLTIFGFQIFL